MAVCSKVGGLYSRWDTASQRRITQLLQTEIEFLHTKSDNIGEIKIGFHGDGEAIEA